QRTFFFCGSDISLLKESMPASGALARPSGTAQLRFGRGPSLTVGLLPRFPNIKRPPFGGHYYHGRLSIVFYCLLPSAYCLLIFGSAYGTRTRDLCLERAAC